MTNVIPFDFKGQQVRTQIIKNEPWFSVFDTCKILGYSNSREAIRKHVEEEDVTKCDTLTKGGNQKLNYVNESGLYSLIFGSKVPEAKNFKKWVTSEILPQIRKQGGYINPMDSRDPIDIAENLIKIAKEQRLQIEKQKAEIESKSQVIEYQSNVLGQVQEKMNIQAQVIEETKPKAQAWEKVVNANGLIDIGQAAKAFNWMVRKFFNQLKDDGILLRNNEPYAAYVQKGYFTTKAVTFKKNGREELYLKPLVTPKGMDFLARKYAVA